MTDMRAAFRAATDHVTVDLEAAVLGEARRRRRRGRAIAVAGAAAFVVLVAAGIAQIGDVPDARRADVGPVDTPSTDAVATPPATVEGAGAATQPVWDPFDLPAAPLSDVEFTSLVGSGGRLQPDIEPGANPVGEDPMSGVVVAWPEVGAGVRLLGTDGRWRSAPAAFAILEETPYPAAPVAISADGTRVAVSTDAGISVLDVTTGEVAVLDWPAELAPPWDYAPELRWLSDDDALLALHWSEPWVIGLDGDARPADYGTQEGVTDVFGIDPDGPVHQNDYPRSTLVTWDGERAVREVPFPQCERLVAAHGLVACTTGSLDSYSAPDAGPRSGPVVVDAATGDIVAYAPIDDRGAVYSDNGRLTAMGFLDPDTVVLKVGPRDHEVPTPPAETWHLVAWRYGDGAFERIASGDQHLADISIAPSLMD
ncbi:hypothetical protein [Nocardioides sp. SYSU DS0663]|uniref:hypothetical protein n=1 Tax=Nocardioides sp. SYSU DS0663 TaxID=3416445 RepID=UPI003F4B7D24